MSDEFKDFIKEGLKILILAGFMVFLAYTIDGLGSYLVNLVKGVNL